MIWWWCVDYGKNITSQSDSTLLDGKYEQDTGMVVAELITSADNGVIHQGDLHHGDLLRCSCTIKPPVLYVKKPKLTSISGHYLNLKL